MLHRCATADTLMSKRRPRYRESSGGPLSQTAESTIAPVGNARIRVILICCSFMTRCQALFRSSTASRSLLVQPLGLCVEDGMSDGCDGDVPKCTHESRGYAVCRSYLRRRILSQRSIAQYDAEERIVDFQAAVVLDEAEFSKLVHEKIHARSRRSDHLGQRFL